MAVLDLVAADRSSRRARRRASARRRRRVPKPPVKTAPVPKPPAPAPTSAPTRGPAPTPTPTSTQTPTPTPTEVPTSTPTSPAPVRLGAGDRHLVRRFSAGLTPALVAEVEATGGGRAWFEKQLDPASIPDPAGDEIDSWFAYLGRTSGEIRARDRTGDEQVWRVMADLSRRTVSRRVMGSRQLHEVMVDCWSNLLHVPTTSEAGRYARADYDAMIRTYALGSFEQLLQSAITHPAMGCNLDNNTSTAAAPNENLGRELLELYSVGVGAYTEADVKNSARILTGWRVDLWPDLKAYYHPPSHATGAVTVMGFTRPNAPAAGSKYVTEAAGRQLTMDYLSYLARHPATAKRVARRLCVKFVRDDPSESLVAAVAAAYTANDTQIKPTLRALVDHPDFAASVGMKLRTPLEDWTAMVRALQITLQKPTDDASFVNAMHWQYRDLGNAPYEWAAPNGFPETNGAWSSAGRMLNSFDIHRRVTGHWWPTAQAQLPDLKTLMPAVPASPSDKTRPSVSLQQLLDVVGTNVLGQTPGAEVSQSVAEALGISLSSPVTARDLNSYWVPITVVASLFDSPLHMFR